jgi:molybdopterin synthase sulfur carrier subunit
MAERAALKVLFFASLRDRLGCPGLELPLPQPPTLEALQALLRERLGTVVAVLAEPEVRIALNQELVDRSVVLNPGDEVAFLPPVTGG